MRNKLFFLTVCLLCGGLLGYAWHTQRSLASAQTVYFEITPQDPRALLSGDYMQLSYVLEEEKNIKAMEKVFSKEAPSDITDEWIKQQFPEKAWIFYADERGRVQTEQTPRPLVVPIRKDGLSVRARLPHQFYFQEGKAKMYENAAYARMARLGNGSFILTGLTDKNLYLLGEEK